MNKIEKLKVEFEIPNYLASDIEAYIIGFNDDCTYLDCLWGEVYGSINMAMSSGQITEEQADLLRKHYL